jgi:hypothetical protein
LPLKIAERLLAIFLVAGIDLWLCHYDNSRIFDLVKPFNNASQVVLFFAHQYFVPAVIVLFSSLQTNYLAEGISTNL